MHECYSSKVLLIDLLCFLSMTLLQWDKCVYVESQKNDTNEHIYTIEIDS